MKAAKYSIVRCLAFCCLSHLSCGDGFSSLAPQDAGTGEVLVQFDPSEGDRGEVLNVTARLPANTDFVCHYAYPVSGSELAPEINAGKFEVSDDCGIDIRLLIGEDAQAGASLLWFKIREVGKREKVLTCKGWFIVNP